MSSTADTPRSDDRQPPFGQAVRVGDLLLAPRRRKGPLLAQIRDLALEGHGCREIGARLSLSKTTVHRWLQELRQECRSKVADPAEMTANAVARYDSIYREAMDAWRNSKMDKEVRFVEDAEAPNGSKKKKSLRTEARAGDVAFLTKAKDAVDSICRLLARDAQRRSNVEAPDHPSIAADDATDKELANMSFDELLAAKAECDAEMERVMRAARPPRPQSTQGTNRDEAGRDGTEAGQNRDETGRNQGVSGTKQDGIGTE